MDVRFPQAIPIKNLPMKSSHWISGIIQQIEPNIIAKFENIIR